MSPAHLLESQMTERELQAQQALDTLLSDISSKLGTTKTEALRKGLHLLEAALQVNVLKSDPVTSLCESHNMASGG